MKLEERFENCITGTKGYVEISNSHAIMFGVFLSQNCAASISKDGWWFYKDAGCKTTDEMLQIFNSNNQK